MLLPTSKIRWLLMTLVLLSLVVLAAAQEGGGPKEVQGEKWALIVGISDYQNVNDLQFADDDAQAIYDLLTKQAGFPTEDDPHTTLLLNEQATKAAIMENLERRLPQAKPDDLVLIYFSGHGSFVKDTDGDEDDGLDEVLVPYDANLGDEGSMIIDDEFGYRIRRLRSQQVIIILDTCYSGGAGRATNVMGIRGEPSDTVVKDLFTSPKASKGRLLMAASGPHQVSYERKDLQHGLFTYYLLEALQGRGDANRDGAVTAEEAFAYAQGKVEGYVAANGLTPPQTPLMEDHLTKGIAITYVGCPKLVGTITTIAGNKERAVEGDEVLIDLGSKNGVQAGDLFQAYHEYQAKGTVAEEIRGRLKVIEVVAKDRSLCEVIESKFPIEVGDKVRRLCEFGPPVENKPPEITSINFPEEIIADGSEVKGKISFKDPDGDVTKVSFELVEGERSTLQIKPDWEFDPQVKGQTEGAIEFRIVARDEGQFKLQATLEDKAGNESKPYSFSFRAVKPLKPAFFKVSDLAVEPSSPTAGEETTIKVTAKNTGEEKGTESVELYINKEREASQEVTLKPGEEQTISFSYTFPKEGSYKVEVKTPDDSHSVEVKVQGRPALEVSPSSLSFSGQAGGSNPNPQSLTVTNAGGGLLEWQATTDADWILPGVNGGTLEAGGSFELSVFVNIQGLSAGTHRGTITISAPGAEGSPVRVEVVLKLSAP